MSKPSTDTTSLKVKPQIETDKRRIAEKYFSKASVGDYNTHRRVGNTSIRNMKESPNYQSIMDMWSDTVSKYGEYTNLMIQRGFEV